MTGHVLTEQPDDMQVYFGSGWLPGGPRHEAECLHAERDSHAGRCSIDSRIVGRVLVRATGITVGAVHAGRVGRE